MARLEQTQVLEGHTDRVWNVAWSPKGDSIASCSGDKTVRIWQRHGTTDTWICAAILEETHHRSIRCSSWSPDGRYLATASFDATTAIWEVQGSTWEQVALLEGHESEVKGVAWSSSGSLLATCSRDKSVWIWESLPGNEYECVDVKQGHTQDVKMVCWHPKGEVLVSCSYDDSIKVWIDSDGEWECAQTLAGPGLGHSSTVWGIAFDTEGRQMVSCSDDQTLRVWACSFDNPGCGDNAIRLFESQAQEGHEKADGSLPSSTFCLAVTKQNAHSADVNCVRWSPSKPDLLASAGDDNTVRLWLYTPDPDTVCSR
ncbi:MAG: putative cytosolic iron-sulfur assembly -like [Trebouxia sp. A1-2]|nr:MAG: putative cytosolic iron-sulfur assembly -like [Trebouxia sp. A1-2]